MMENPEARVVELFTREVPEIDAGIVKIRAVARRPRVRTKIAVESSDPVVDPVAACVGEEGNRVSAVARALEGERIDIMPWEMAPERRVRLALALMRIERVELDPDARRARVWVHSEQLSTWHEEGDLHRELASRLAGWTIHYEE